MANSTTRLGVAVGTSSVKAEWKGGSMTPSIYFFDLHFSIFFLLKKESGKTSYATLIPKELAAQRLLCSFEGACAAPL